jgi:hypothetical protein
LTVTASSRRYFLVERYLPEADVRSVVAATRRQTDANDDPRHIGTVIIAAEETCLSVFEAVDARSVAAAIEAAGLPADRIVEAEWFPGPST